MAKYIITTVSTFVHKYAIEAETEEQAKAEWVLLNNYEYENTYPDCCEIKQTHVAEDIVDVREVTDENIVNEAHEHMKDYVLTRVRVVNREDN